MMAATAEVKIPEPRISLWRAVPVSALERLERAGSEEDVRRVLSAVLDVGRSLCEPRASALLDLHYFTLRFCWDRGFSREQTSCVLSIVAETHAACVGSPLENTAECHRHFQELLLCHAVHRPPFSIGLLSPQQLLSVADYVLKTYFRHMKLYKYVFTPQVRLDLTIVCDEVTASQDTSDGGDVHAADEDPDSSI